MTVNQLSVLSAVIECGGYAKAAEKLYTSPSALLQQVHALEKELGFPILQKKKKGMELTNAGRAFWSKAEGGLKLLQSGVEDGKTIVAAEQATLRIGLANRGLNSPQRLMELILIFHREHPDVRIEFVNCDYCDVAKELTDGKYDIRYTQYLPVFAEKNLTWEEVDRTHYCCLMMNTDPLAGKEILNAEDLSGRTICLHRYDETDTIVEDMQRWSPGIHVQLSEVSHSQVFQSCMAGGLFILRTKEVPVREPLCSARLDCSIPGSHVAVAGPNPSPCAMRFLEVVRKLKAPCVLENT